MDYNLKHTGERSESSPKGAMVLRVVRLRSPWRSQRSKHIMKTHIRYFVLLPVILAAASMQSSAMNEKVPSKSINNMILNNMICIGKKITLWASTSNLTEVNKQTISRKCKSTNDMNLTGTALPKIIYIRAKTRNELNLTKNTDSDSEASNDEYELEIDTESETDTESDDDN